MNKSENDIYQDFADLHKDIKGTIGTATGVLDLFHVMRYQFLRSSEDEYFLTWYNNIWSDDRAENSLSDTIRYVEEYMPANIRAKLNDYLREKNWSWDDIKFHIHCRLISQEDFLHLVLETLREAAVRYAKGFASDLIKAIDESEEPAEVISRYSCNKIVRGNKVFSKFLKLREKIEAVENVLTEGYDMSVLPLNMLLPTEALLKYIPEADYFRHRPRSFNPDPYGHEEQRIKGESGLLLGTHKFKHSFLMDIHTVCPIGCVGCYKTFYTREKGDNHRLGVSSETLETQIGETVEWLNNNPDVYDIIISGGEPLLIDLDNRKTKKMFEGFKETKYLKVVRICTGVIFQGLPFRIDDSLLDIVEDFCIKTGKRFTFQVHLINHYQMTPEALLAVSKIRAKGFNIYSQVPIQEGINFFRNNMAKTKDFLVKLGRYQVRAQVEPYKYIVDMHPRTQERYVPIELLCRAWRELGESHAYPELERPRTLSILCKQGNIILSWYMLKHMRKKIVQERNEVVYEIPAVTGVRPLREEIVEYTEPLIPGINDSSEAVPRVE